MPTRYGRSPWIDQFPKSRVPAYPTLRGPLDDVDVVIIGGGLTGCATAYAFAAAGVKVALLEAGRLGHGSSSASTGWIADDPGVNFADVERLIGLKAARHAWRAWRRASLDFIALIKRLELKCDLEPQGSLVVGATAEQAAHLAREQKIRKAAGLDASLVRGQAIATETAIDAMSALRSRDGATIDPYRATLGLAAAAVKRGARIFEQTPVRRITFTRKHADVFTAAGPTRVGRIVVATGVPTLLFKSLARHFWFKSSYLALTEPVPAKIRQRLGTRALIVRDSVAPPHTIRWVDETRLLVSGADGVSVPERKRAQTIVQRTGQLMYELSTIYPDISGIRPAYGWDAPYALTAEALPYIGAHRNFPFHLFAFGDSSQSLTGAYLASRIMLRHHLGEADAADDAFGFHR
jgi:glycine/D-amino acid oxidase-like deaminating enzyme